VFNTTAPNTPVGSESTDFDFDVEMCSFCAGLLCPHCVDLIYDDAEYRALLLRQFEHRSDCYSFVMNIDMHVAVGVPLLPWKVVGIAEIEKRLVGIEENPGPWVKKSQHTERFAKTKKAQSRVIKRSNQAIATQASILDGMVQLVAKKDVENGVWDDTVPKAEPQPKPQTKNECVDLSKPLDKMLAALLAPKESVCEMPETIKCAGVMSKAALFLTNVAPSLKCDALNEYKFVSEFDDHPEVEYRGVSEMSMSAMRTKPRLQTWSVNPVFVEELGQSSIGWLGKLVPSVVKNFLRTRSYMTISATLFGELCATCPDDKVFVFDDLLAKMKFRLNRMNIPTYPIKTTVDHTCRDISPLDEIFFEHNSYILDIIDDYGMCKRSTVVDATNVVRDTIRLFQVYKLSKMPLSRF